MNEICNESTVTIVKQVEEQGNKLKQIVSVIKSTGCKTQVICNDMSKSSIVNQRANSRVELMPEILNLKSVQRETRMTYNDTTNISIGKPTSKPWQSKTPPMPIPIAIDDIKTKYIISVEDDSDKCAPPFQSGQTIQALQCHRDSGLSEVRQ